MLDTVILNIPKKDFNVILPNNFSPPAIHLDITGTGFAKCVNNARAPDKKAGLYLPRLTLIKRRTKSGSIVSLRAEFSVPKLLFGNNLDELEESDFPEVVARLNKAIAHMGVWVKPEAIELAEVSALHASKNIVLTGGYTASFAIQELAKINLTKKLDLDKTSFRNSGQSLQLYSGSNAVAIYDKLNDLTKPKSRAVDKDQSYGQQDLFEAIKKREPGLEILRIEVRLAKKVKLQEVLKKVGYTGGLDFQSLFKKSLCQKILQRYWQELITPNVMVLSSGTDPFTTLENIVSHNPKIGIKEAVYQTGLQLICRDKGIRPFRGLVERHATTRTWNRVSESIKKADKAISPARAYGFIHDITDSLNSFESYKHH